MEILIAPSNVYPPSNVFMHDMWPTNNEPWEMLIESLKNKCRRAIKFHLVKKEREKSKWRDIGHGLDRCLDNWLFEPILKKIGLLYAGSVHKVFL